MNRIRLLPEQFANQIAAGEVVERPASVVKELVENALDAQAGRITVEIQAGGRSLIRVTDDGAGMSRDDALLCLERHATSKIQCAEDLASIYTMGFRGEALPSIASVSRFTLTTREQATEVVAGTAVVINGGKIVEVKEAGWAPGTSVEVRQLFFNLPARRKFLRTAETERAHIQHYLMLAALAHPRVVFAFTNDSRLIWQLPSARPGEDSAARLAALLERLQALHGGGDKWIPVDFAAALAETPDSESGVDSPDLVLESPIANRQSRVRLWGFIGAPGVSRATREHQNLFVNRRPVENRGLNFALIEGYHTALMKGRYPVCCLFLEIDPAAVDVNIHPAKREVKFHQERTVRGIVTQAIRQALLRFHAGGLTGGPLSQSPVPAGVTGATATASASTKPPALAVTHLRPPDASPRALPDSPTAEESPSAGDVEQRSLPMAAPDPPTGPVSSGSVPSSEAPSGLPAAQPSASAPPLPAAPVPLLSVPLRLVGVIGNLYVVLESDRGMVLMDQHAAHERVLYEQMLNRMEQGGVAPSQRLLLPETVELPPRDAQFLTEQLSTLARLGVGLSEFGERTFLLDALPPFVKASDARRFVLELVDALKAAGGSVNILRLGEHTIAKTVCRHAVKANDPLQGAELENLVTDLRQCAMPYTCPHGRPTLIEMSLKELEKKFGRVQ